MERVQKELTSRDAASAGHVAQGKSAQLSAQTDMASRILNSPLMATQRKQLQGMFGDMAQLQTEEEEPLQGRFATAQLEGIEEEEPLQGTFDVAQGEGLEDEEPLQGKFVSAPTTQLEQQPVAKPNNTGLPDSLKTGIESLSGMSMDSVKVHYNSSQPAQLNALAYAQGSDIHVAPGQEQHLPHEAWHVVQQAQGRVQSTMQMKDGVPVNDDPGLEHEADVMGGMAVQMVQSSSKSIESDPIDLDRSGADVMGEEAARAGRHTVNADGEGWGSDIPMQVQTGLQSGTQPIQAFFMATPIANETSLLQNIMEALQSGERKINEKELLIPSRENVRVLAPMFRNPARGNVTSYEHSQSFQKWAGSALNRLEEGAESLSGDVQYWVSALKTEPGVYVVEPLGIHLTGAELHERGLGVSFLDLRITRQKSIEEGMSVDSLTRPGPVTKETRRVVLKPDNRSFEKAVLGKGKGSVAEQLNVKAKLGDNAITTINMATSTDHGSIVQYVEENLLTYLKSWQCYLTNDKQPVIEAISFAFIAGLWDLHSENVKMVGGKPVFIDAEVGYQPEIFKNQHQPEHPKLRNAGLGTVQHQVVDDQLSGGTNGSVLIVWAKQNVAELIGILKDTVGNEQARIVPVFTSDWFYFKNRFLEYTFAKDAEVVDESLRAASYASKTIDDAANSIDDGYHLAHSPGLKKQIGPNKLGVTNTFYLKETIKGDFMKGVIPEFLYQPSTGCVSFNGRIIWEGENLDDSMNYLSARLK